MKLYHRVKGFAWIFLLSLSGTVIRIVAAEDDLIIIKVNDTPERQEKCNGLSETFESSSIEISSSTLSASYTCTLSSPQMGPVFNISETENKTLNNQSKDNIAFEVVLPCIAKSDWKPTEELQLMLIPSKLQSTQVLLMSQDSNSCKLPITVINKGIFHIECDLLSDNNTSDVVTPYNGTKTHQNVSISILKGRNMLVDSNGTAGVEEDARSYVNSPLLHTRPAHNNVVVIAVICVLVGIIVLAGSLILVSLVMHRKRLSRRLAIHLRKLEEAGHPEAVPLTDMPDRRTDQHVKLVGLRRLDSSGCELTKLREIGFQPVSPSDISVFLPTDCYEPELESDIITEELSRSCDTTSINNELSISCDNNKTCSDLQANETPAVKVSDSDSSSGDSASFQDSIGDNLEQSLTGNDSGSNTEDKSVQTLNTGSFYQMFPSVMKFKIPKLRWRTKSCDSEHT